MDEDISSGGNRSVGTNEGTVTIYCFSIFTLVNSFKSFMFNAIKSLKMFNMQIELCSRVDKVLDVYFKGSVIH